MSIDASSLTDLRRAFDAAGEATLDLLIGEHRAELVGPWYIRKSAPGFLAATGMPGWCGKRFGGPMAETLHGCNLARRGGVVQDSIPLTATLEGGELVVHYPADARWPWRNVTDRLRPLGAATLIGLTYGLPLTPALPFLLHRDD